MYGFAFFNKETYWFNRISKLQKKPPALLKEHPTRQNMKFLQFCVYLFTWLQRLQSQLNPDHSESDPKHLWWVSWITLLNYFVVISCAQF